MQKNPVKVIREKCLDCCAMSAKEVQLCGAKECPLYPFRFGKNPYREKRELTDEQKAKQIECLRRARESKM